MRKYDVKVYWARLMLKVIVSLALLSFIVYTLYTDNMVAAVGTLLFFNIGIMMEPSKETLSITKKE